MRFRIEQVVEATPEQVQAALVDPLFLERLASLPKLGRPELVEQRSEGETLHQRVRYRFVGDLNSAARAVLDPARLTWIEESSIDLRTRQTTFRILPDHYADKLSAQGTFRLMEEGLGTAPPTAEGELKVRMPLVGGRVERAIISGLKEHAVLEAQALAEWLLELGR